MGSAAAGSSVGVVRAVARGTAAFDSGVEAGLVAVAGDGSELGVDVDEGLALCVGVAVGDSVGSGVPVGVAIGSSVGGGVSVGVAVGGSVGGGVSVGVAAGVGSGVSVGVAAGGSVGSDVSVGVAAGGSVGRGVSVSVAISVGVALGSLGGAGVWTGAESAALPMPLALAAPVVAVESEMRVSDEVDVALPASFATRVFKAASLAGDDVGTADGSGVEFGAGVLSVGVGVGACSSVAA